MNYWKHAPKELDMSVEVGSVKYKVELDDKDVGKQADKAQNTLTSKFGSAAKSIGAAALATSAAVASAATAAVADITKQAVSAYADFEQLWGGIDKLFGTGGKSLEEYAAAVGKTAAEATDEYLALGDAAFTVGQNANEAFRTVGMSSNDYMRSITGFSAALINSLGGDTKAAADMADVAMRDIADNANTFGKYTVDEITGVYQALAKGQFQTLDNLNLGYGGTKEGMQALIDKANELGAAQGENANLTIDSFADIVEAIHRVQENMSIAGTTEREAAGTISGSIEMTKAAWENLMLAVASGNKDWDMEGPINDLITSLEALSSNILPIVEGALIGVSELIARMAPEIAEKLPSMITEALPGLLDAGVQAIKALSDGLLSSVQSLMPTATSIVMELAQMIIQMAPDIVQTGIELIVQLALGLAEALPELIPTAVDAVLTIVDTLLDNIDMVVDAAIQLIIALADGLIQALPKLIEKAPEIIIKLVEALVRNFPKIVGAGTDLVVKLIEGITKCWGQVISTGADIITQVKNGFSSRIQDALNWGRDLISNFVQGIRNKFSDVKSALSDLGNLIADLIGFSEPKEGVLSHFHEFAPDMMDLYAKGIDDNIGVVEDSVTDVAKTIAGSFTADVGYNLPDIAGYAADLSASMTASSATEIIVPLTVDGREIARASAWYMNEQLAWEAR